MKDNKLYQVSTLGALALGYTRKVKSIGEVLEHGDTGLGTFEDVNGEMITLDGHCYRAKADGTAEEVDKECGTPFCVVTFLQGKRQFELTGISDIDSLKQELDLKVEEDFGLNSMHMVRIDGDFELVRARSEIAERSQHVELKELLDGNQKDFDFKDIRGSLVALHFPDYMDETNAVGWHFHFISEDRKTGGHVFDLKMRQGKVFLDKISAIEVQLPTEAAFDTYSLKQASNDDIKKVEQGK